MGRGGGSCDDHHLLLISEDVLIQILLWVPVISLLKFKSVCKSWRSIIESSFFIHLHASTTHQLGGSSSVLISFRVQEKEKKGNILTLSGEELEFFENLCIPATLLEYLIGKEVQEEDFWWLEALERFVNFWAVGCCDGIICLHDYFTRNVALWNAAIKQSRVIPKPSNLLGFSKCFSNSHIRDNDGYVSDDFVRFGIDIKTNDYKLLLITTLKLTKTKSPYACRRRVHVYSLSTDSWKCIAAHPNLDIDIKTHQNQGLYLNGSYFFTAIRFNGDMSLLMSFDFTEEIFRTIQPPFDVSNKNISADAFFVRLGGKVALINFKEEFESLDRDFGYSIWVLNEQHNGMKESWTKFYTIGPPGRLSNQPLFITNNGEFAIIYDGDWQDDQLQDVLQLLNLITGEKKLLRCDCEGMVTDLVYAYKPSLMPIGGNGATPT